MRSYFIKYSFVHLGTLCLFCCLQFTKLQLWGQEYAFEFYNQVNGLANGFINTINQDSYGRMIFGTGEGVARYDGMDFEMFHTHDSLAEDFISASYHASNGEIWFGHKQGGVSVYNGLGFEIKYKGAEIKSRINDITEDRSGNIWFAAQSFGLAYCNSKGIFTLFNQHFDGEFILSLEFLLEDYLLVGTNYGVQLFYFDAEDNSLSKVSDVSGIQREPIFDFVKVGSQTMAVNPEGKIYSIEKSGNVVTGVQIKIPELYPAGVKGVFCVKNELLVSTFDKGLMRYQLKGEEIQLLNKFGKYNGLQTSMITCSFVDREGVLWLGTFGEGVSSKLSNQFAFYRKDEKEPFSVQSICSYDDTVVVSHREKLKFCDVNGRDFFTYDLKFNGAPLKISCIFRSEGKRLFVGTEGGGLFEFKGRKFVRIKLSDDQLSEVITCMSGKGNKLWVGTFNGVYELDLRSMGIVSYTVSSGLANNTVGAIYYSSKGVLLVGTRSSYLSRFDDGIFVNIPLSNGFPISEVNKIVEDISGKIWLSTSDKGVFYIESENNVQNIATTGGLLSNYCIGMEVDKAGDIWVMHNGGLSKIWTKNLMTDVYNSRQGLDLNYNKNSISRVKNFLWFGTASGVVSYNYAEDRINVTEPKTCLTKILIDDVGQILKSGLEIPYNRYNLLFHFQGISQKDPNGIKFQYWLEGYDDAWSELTPSRSARYSKVDDGDYTFHVRSISRSGLIGSEVLYRFIIEKPFWKKWWFYGIGALFVIAVLLMVIKVRERRLIAYQKKLESELELRTREVVEKKDEIEVINKDLTDSINYAKRIQNAISPQMEELSQLFEDHFVINFPRDIVSGDFYWVREIGRYRFVACGDCTGHGVPGGFMSMISAMLLYESIVLKGIYDPSEIMVDLDTNLVEVLRQKDDFESNKDGMDLSICVIDTINLSMDYCGAMRPALIYRMGVMHELKGDRFSLGGTLVKEKIFQTQQFQLELNDVVYVFSDGYSDQFGGPYRRKMKIAGLIEFLDQISELELLRQKAELEKFYQAWKGDVAQMDDVMMLGFKI